jgi:transposase InsO family protein
LYFEYGRSSYYKSLSVEASCRLEEDIVCQLVQDLRRYQPNIGGKKLYYLLKEDLDRFGERRIGRDKFFDILRKHGLLVKRKRKYVYTTDSFHRFRVYKNVLKHKLLTGPHQGCVSDITYLRTRSGFVYLFLITDAYSRKIIGWSLSDSLAIEGGLEALHMAVKQCPDPLGLIHHSDRGIQYCCNDYVNLLKQHKITISMTEENHCYENAIAERVNGILKQEFLLDETFQNMSMAQRAVKEAIETYNTRRPHWSLNLSTPEQIHTAA